MCGWDWTGRAGLVWPTGVLFVLPERSCGENGRNDALQSTKYQVILRAIDAKSVPGKVLGMLFTACKTGLGTLQNAVTRPPWRALLLCNYYVDGRGPDLAKPTTEGKSRL